MTNKKKYIILTIFTASMIAIVSSITAFFTETEYRANSITVGEVKIEIKEDYTEQVVYPNESVEKNPSVKNVGKNEAYVFIEVDIPKAEVILLDDDGQLLNATTPKSVQELFQMIAEKSGTETDANIKIVPNNDSFSYHDKWVLLSDKTISTQKDYNTYVFAYSEPLKRNNTTSVLFDKVQLKKFIDSEASAQNKENPVVKIDVRAYAIQSDNLEGMTHTSKQNGFYAELYDIYHFPKN